MLCDISTAMDIMHILIIEDEKKVARALKEGLEQEKFVATIADNGEDGFFLVHSQPFDLVLLDLNLPGRDGLEVLRTMRIKGINTPVLILTARDSLESKVTGLEIGADDYLVKPFAFPELVARIRALARRGKSEPDLHHSLADLELDLVTRKVIRNKQQVLLTVKEFDLLEYFLRHKYKLVSREMLGREVWNDMGRATPLDNVIDVHITHLRKKIDEPFDRKLLHTIRGVGFMLTDEHQK
jgi:DNA-binding response OmpR family regulator